VEGGRGFRRCGLESGPARVIVTRDAHATPATSASCLDHHGISDPIGLLNGVGSIFEGFAPGEEWQSELLGDFAGAKLVSPEAHGLGGRANEAQTALGNDI